MYICWLAFENDFVFFFFPETAGKTLEEPTFLFEERSWQTVLSLPSRRLCTMRICPERTKELPRALLNPRRRSEYAFR